MNHNVYVYQQITHQAQQYWLSRHHAQQCCLSRHQAQQHCLSCHQVKNQLVNKPLYEGKSLGSLPTKKFTTSPAQALL